MSLFLKLLAWLPEEVEFSDLLADSLLVEEELEVVVWESTA